MARVERRSDEQRCTPEREQELDRKLGEFEHRGSEVVAISGDTAERAQQSKREWRLERLTIGCQLPIEAMPGWGRFISHAIKEDEPEYFSEPAVFMVGPQCTVFFEAINSAPFARPPIDGLLEAIDFVTENDYPARDIDRGWESGLVE